MNLNRRHFLTLAAGGAAMAKGGDEVEAEIGGIGTLVNYVRAS